MNRLEEELGLDMEKKQQAERSEVDFLYEIGAHMAAADPLDEALSDVVNFARFLVNCDSAFIYVREAQRFILWVWKNSGHEVVETIEAGHEIVRYLTVHRVPVAILDEPQPAIRLKRFEEWSQETGETFVAVPLLSRGKLVGLIVLRHHEPHVYRCQEIQALSSAGFLVGAEIGTTLLEREKSDLLLELETRKLVERGKGILQRDLGLSEEQVYLTLQRQSRQRRKSMKEIAQALILGEEVKRGYQTH